MGTTAPVNNNPPVGNPPVGNPPKGTAPPVSTTPPVNAPPTNNAPPTTNAPPTGNAPPVSTTPPVNAPPTNNAPPVTTTPPTTPPPTTYPIGGGFGGLFPFPYGGFGGGYGGGYGGASGGSYGGVASAPVDSTPVASTPAASTDAVVQASYAAPIAPVTGAADLVVEDVQMVGSATLAAGPAYRVQFRNQGTVAAGPFRVGIFAALDGKLTDSRAVLEVPGLEAGQAADVVLRLPQSALRLVSSSGHTFDKLAVMVDIDGRLHESDKTNNAAVLDRSVLEAAK